MSTAIGPDDQAGFEKAKERIVAAFVAAEGTDSVWVVEQVLEFKWAHLDGHLETWSPADVDAVLFRIYPQKVMLDDDQILQVPPAFASFLRFLGPRDDGPAARFTKLAQTVERAASRFVAGMHDEENWSFGKRMWSTAIGEGVDLSDQAAVARWVQGFNARSLAERDQILGPMPAARGASGAQRIVVPPVVLATDDELRSLASEAVLVQRLVTLVQFVGAGRAVTDRGNLKLADGKALVGLLGTDDQVDPVFGDQMFKTMSAEELAGVDYTFRVALAADLVTIVGRKVLPGANVGWVPESVLDIAYGAASKRQCRSMSSLRMRGASSRTRSTSPTSRVTGARATTTRSTRRCGEPLVGSPSSASW